MGVGSHRSRLLYVLISTIALLTLAVWAGSAFWSRAEGSDKRGMPVSSAMPVLPVTSAIPSGLTMATPEQLSALPSELTVTPTQTLVPYSPPTDAPSATSSSTSTSTATFVPTATNIPLPSVTPEPFGGPVTTPNKHKGPRWVTLQAGHWNSAKLPEELSHLRANTGAYAAGVSEVDLNVAIAKRTAQFLYARGYSVQILNATVPVSYTTDLFLAIHADGNEFTSVRGFKAVSPWGAVPASEDFVSFLYEEYGKATGLPSDAMTSDTMANYYAFNPTRYRHAVTPNVPSALIETGFITNPLDRKALTTEQARIAWGITNAIDRYFRSGVAGPTPSPYPTFTPSATPTFTPSSTSTPSSTATAIPTSNPTAVATEFAAQATQTAAAVTPELPTSTPRLPKPTSTPIPTSTPLTGIITTDGRWLPPLSLNGQRLPLPGSKADPVLLSESTDALPVTADGRKKLQMWQQFYVPRLGRSIWRKGPIINVRD
ncbi:MAG: N-acetylmuramoyl-L-alanine amidase [Chloroflexi bacterium]|nr:N-acetylmuramoyl-L-alanine amidase [Chloroflexota bacterium]